MRLKCIQTVIAKSEAVGNHKYSRSNSNKPCWTAEDHYARFLVQAHNGNLIDIKEQFYDKQISDSEIDLLLCFTY